MANRDIAAGALAAMALAHFAGCSTMPVATRATVAAREEVLLEAPVTWGRLLRSKHENVSWHGDASLLLTPTTIYVIHPRGHEAISYALISHAVVRPDGPRPVWLSSGSRNASYWWSSQPEYMKRTEPELKAALDRWFCAQTDCNGGGRTLSIYDAGLREALPAESGSGYSFRALDGLTVNRRAELDIGSLAEALRLADPSVDSLLVSALTGIRLSEKVSADYRISVEVSLDAFVDYFDIDPLKDGRYFWHTYTVTRTAEDWLLLDAAGFAADVALAARSVACRVQQELSAHGGAEGDAACVSGPPDHSEDAGLERATSTIY